MIAFFCKNLGTVHRSSKCTTTIFSPYLVGFARKLTTITIASEKLPEHNNAEIVKTLLGNYGFTDAQINKLINMRPQILSTNPHKTLLPKLDFFCSIGLSNTDIPRIIFGSHALLGRSLENQIIPCCNFLKTVLSLDEDVVRMLKHNPRILMYSVEKNLSPNISLLRAVGVPQSVVSSMLRSAVGSAVHQDSHKFKQSVNKAIEMGFDPMKVKFVQAVQVFCEMHKSTWENKMEVYERCGLSKDEIQLAFRSNPLCMCISEGKIMQGVNFLVKKMGWRPADIARCPSALSLSLEKRIIPRCNVIKVLVAAGLVKRDPSLSSFLLPSEKRFLDKYVNKYKDDLPGLMNIYLGKMPVTDKNPQFLDIGSEIVGSQ